MPNEITLRMVKAGGDALRGQIAEVGCTCPCDENGTPIKDCKCGDRQEKDRWALAERVLRAALAEREPAYLHRKLYEQAVEEGWIKERRECSDHLWRRVAGRWVCDQCGRTLYEDDSVNA